MNENCPYYLQKPLGEKKEGGSPVATAIGKKLGE